MFSPTAHAAHISHYINPLRFSVHGKISVLCSKVRLHFFLNCALPLIFFSLLTFSLSYALSL